MVRFGVSHDDDAEIRSMKGRDMANSTLIRTALLVALIAWLPLGRAARASPAAEPGAARCAGRAPAGPGRRRATPTSRFVPLGVGKSVVIDLPRDIKDVLVADPKIANAVVRSARRAYIIGVTVGQTNVFFFDAEGKPDRRPSTSR